MHNNYPLKLHRISSSLIQDFGIKLISKHSAGWLSEAQQQEQMEQCQKQQEKVLKNTRKDSRVVVMPVDRAKLILYVFYVLTHKTTMLWLQVGIHITECVTAWKTNY